METKECTKCGKSCPVSEFYVANRETGQLNPQCKACYREWHRGRYTPKTGATDDERECAQCGATYAPLQRRPSMFCSKRCKDNAKNAARQAAIDAAKPHRECVHCGKALAREMRSDAKFCSAECNSAAHAITRKMAKRAGRAKKFDDPLLERNYIARRDQFRCGICGGRVDMKLNHPDPMYGSIDHIVPLAAGGGNELSNLQLAHLRCNLAKRQYGGGEQMLLIG